MSLMKIGKRTPNGIYVHKDYESTLRIPAACSKIRLRKFYPDYEYQVVKYNRRNGYVSFIQSPDFDTADEPTVIESKIVDFFGKVKTWKGPVDNPFIYHHKHMFVADDYSGFDVEASKRRSAAWTKLSGIDRNKIGRRNYWEENVVPRII